MAIAVAFKVSAKDQNGLTFDVWSIGDHRITDDQGHVYRYVDTFREVGKTFHGWVDVTDGEPITTEVLP